MLRSLFVATTTCRGSSQAVRRLGAAATSSSTASGKSDLEVLRSRLLYQSRKRGILECDIVLGGFAERHLAGMSETQLRSYDKLINGNHVEWDLYYWLAGEREPPKEVASCPVFQLIASYVKKGPSRSN